MMSSQSSFEFAVQKVIPGIAHAGEACGPDRIRETIEYFCPQRIGHGVRSIEDKALVYFLADSGIYLEVCPTCDIQTDISRYIIVL
jgi:adenosine deaminase